MKLYGKNSVIERLRFNPASIRQIFIQSGYREAGIIQKKARQCGVGVRIIEKTHMGRLNQHNSQAVVMDVEDFDYADFDEILEKAKTKKHTIFFLDNLNDPQNLGAIMRSLGCLGRFSLVLPTHNSVHVTEAVLRVACGAENHIPVARVSNLSQAIKRAKEAGLWIAAAVVEDGEDVTKASFPFPLGIVVGSEQKGVRDAVLKNVDLKITIPMAVDTLSFNVAHAVAIIGYEITKQKIKGKIES